MMKSQPLPAQAQFSNDLVNTGNAAVNTALPLTSAQLDAVIQKVNELILAARR